MKKILLSLLAVLMLFAFVACENPSGPSNVKPETENGSTNNNGTSDNDTDVKETWEALTSLEGVEGAFRWDDFNGMDEETQVLRFGNNEVVLEFYENGELDDSDTISTEEFLKIAVEQGCEINNTKTKIRVADDMEYIKFSGTVEKSWTTVTSLEGLNGTWIYEQESEYGSVKLELIIDNGNVTMTTYFGDEVYPRSFTEKEFFDFVKAEYDSDVSIYRTGEKLAAGMVFNKQK